MLTNIFISTRWEFSEKINHTILLSKVIILTNLNSLDMEKAARRIATTFILFVIGSYAASYAPGFWTTVKKGSVLGILIWPPVYLHYANEDNY